MKCDIDKFTNVDKNDYITYKKNKYDYEILVSDKAKIKKKYKDMIVDNITLEDLMVLIIKGDKNEGIN